MYLCVRQSILYKTEPNSSGNVPTKTKIPSLSAALTVQQWRRRDTPAYQMVTAGKKGHMSMAKFS